MQSLEKDLQRTKAKDISREEKVLRENWRCLFEAPIREGHGTRFDLELP